MSYIFDNNYNNVDFKMLKDFMNFTTNKANYGGIRFIIDYYKNLRSMK